MATTKSTQVYLEREHKNGLQAKAEAHGTTIGEEVRRAVDAYLTGTCGQDLQRLDDGTRKAGRHLKDMADELQRVNNALDIAFARLSSKRRKTLPH